MRMFIAFFGLVVVAMWLFNSILGNLWNAMWLAIGLAGMFLIFQTITQFNTYDTNQRRLALFFIGLLTLIIWHAFDMNQLFAGLIN